MRLDRWALSVFLALLSAPQAVAQTSLRHFDYRGHGMGDSLWNTFGTCVGVGQTITTCEEQTTVGSTRVHAHYAFHENRFTGLSLEFATERYRAIVDALTAKFGPPDTAWREPVHNRMGAEYANEIVAWRTDGGLLSARQYGQHLDVGRVDIESPEGAAAAKAAADSAALRAKKDL